MTDNPNDTQTDAPLPRFTAVDSNNDGAADRVGVDDDRDGKVDRDADVYVTRLGGANIKVAILEVEQPPPPKVTIKDLLDQHGREVEVRVRGHYEPLLEQERELRRSASAAVKSLQSTWRNFWRWVAGLVSASGVAYVLMAGYYGHAWWAASGGAGSFAPSPAPVVGLPATAERQAVYDTIKGSLLDDAERARVRVAMGLEGGDK